MRTTFWGYESWRRHPAKYLLRKDFDDGKHLEMKLSQLRDSRPQEYGLLELKIFRRRFHQEIKAVKQANLNASKKAKEEDDSRGEVAEWSSSEGEWSSSDEEDGG